MSEPNSNGNAHQLLKGVISAFSNEDKKRFAQSLQISIRTLYRWIENPQSMKPIYSEKLIESVKTFTETSCSN